MYLLLLLFVGVVGLSGSLVFLFSERIKAYHKPISTFAAALVATLIFVHILPDIYVLHDSVKWLGMAVLLGLVAQLILEKVTHGIEHNHHHSHAKSHKSILIGVMLGLGVHAMIEGMPMLHEEIAIEASSEEHIHNHHDHVHLEASKDGLTTKFITAVIMHKIPVTVVFGIFMLSLGIKARSYFLLLGIFSLTTPVGAILGKYLQNIQHLAEIKGLLMAFSTGMLLHIITSIMFEHGHSKKENNLHIILILIAIALGYVLF